MRHAEQSRKRRGGFTLVEMLVVIAIIVVLASMLVPTVMHTLGVVREAAIAIEITQLDAALRTYKNQHGSYPPNSDPAATAEEPLLRQHVTRLFPRANFTLPYGMDAGETLVFWLQGYAGDVDPLGSGRQPIMQFDATRLKPTRVVNGFPLYHYSPAQGQGQPYVYIHNASYNALTFTPIAPGSGTARACKSSVATNDFVNADSFQIISAGLDGNYGGPSADKQFPAGLNYASGDRDNITNFSGGALRNKLP